MPCISPVDTPSLPGSLSSQEDVESVSRMSWRCLPLPLKPNIQLTDLSALSSHLNPQSGGRCMKSSPCSYIGRQRSLVGCSPWGCEECRTRLSDFLFTFHFHALEKEMTTHSSVLAWRIPGMGEPGGLPSMGSHRVGHD